MKRKIILILAAAAILCICTGYGLSSILYSNRDMYIPSLRITGDVYEPYSLNSMDGFSTVYIDNKNEKVKSISLKDVIDRSKPVSEKNKLLIMGSDGLVAEIECSNIGDCYIAFDYKNGWESINLNHPVSSNIKMIARIAVVSEDPFDNYGVNIITPEKEIIKITPGQMYLKELRQYTKFEGTSSIDREGKAYSDSIYTTHRYIKLTDIAGVDSNILVMGAEGGYSLNDGQGYLELNDNTIDYVFSDMETVVKNISGIMMDIPKRTVMDTYYDSGHYIDNGQNVMVLYLDGFSYDEYINAVGKGYAPYLKSLTEADRASTVYKPVTNAGFAAMITGKGPDENGVYSREQKDLKVPDIFKYVADTGGKAALAEGNIKILNTGVEPVLNVDSNNSGSCDDEIYESALDLIKKDCNFLMVHFHSIDDSGHDFGNMDERTMKTVSTIDGYVKNLVSQWKGKVIITADHGMHEVQSAGDHGSFCPDDMIVPYLIIGGGDK